MRLMLWLVGGRVAPALTDPTGGEGENEPRPEAAPLPETRFPPPRLNHQFPATTTGCVQDVCA